MAKKKVVRKSQVRIDYERQVRRIKGNITRVKNQYKKQGIIVDVDFQIPETPKRVTKKQVENLRKIKIQDLRNKARKIDKQEISIIEKQETESITWGWTIINNMLSAIHDSVMANHGNAIKIYNNVVRHLHNAISRYSMIDVAKSINNTPADKVELFWYCVHYYPSEIAAMVFVEIILSYMPDISPNKSDNEDMFDSILNDIENNMEDEWLDDDGTPFDWYDE